MAKAPAAALKSDPPAPEATIAAPPAPTVVEAPIAAAAAPKLPPVAQNCWSLKEHQNPGGWLCVPKDYTVEMLLDPTMWANVAGKMRPFSTVEVHWADASQFAEFYVLASARNWASVCLLRHHVLGKGLRPPQAHEFRVEFNGPVDRWRIVNVANRTVLQAGFAGEAEAQRFLAEHLKKIGG